MAKQFLVVVGSSPVVFVGNASGHTTDARLARRFIESDASLTAARLGGIVVPESSALTLSTSQIAQLLSAKAGLPATKARCACGKHLVEPDSRAEMILALLRTKMEAMTDEGVTGEELDEFFRTRETELRIEIQRVIGPLPCSQNIGASK